MKHTLIRTTPDEPEAFAGCSRAPAPPARRAAGAAPVFVNGVAIPESAIAQEAQNHSAASGAVARAAAAHALVVRELLLQRARALDLTAVQSVDSDGREETDEEALVRQVLALEAPPVQPSEAECRRVYAAWRAKISEVVAFEASHILFAAESSAEAAIEALAGGADFAALARCASLCPSGELGGSLGALRQGDLAPEIESVLLALPNGCVAPAPVRTRHGWHVVRLDRVMPAAPPSFEAVSEPIRASLLARAALAAAARYVARLAASADIEGVTIAAGSPA